MRRSWLLLITALIAGIVTLAGCSSASSEPIVTFGSGASADPLLIPGVTTYDAGSRPSIPPLAGTTLSGGSFAVSSLIGHVVVINAWGSWCAPCKEESPALAKVATQTAAMGVRFVGIDVSDDSGKARSFTASVGTTYPQLVDADQALLRQIRLLPPNVPGTLILDSNGLVAARIIGPASATELMTILGAVTASTTPAP